MHSKTIRDLEQSMMPVKEAMRQRGLNIDLSKLESLINESVRSQLSIEEKLRTALGIEGEVNLNSAKDISVILSTSLGVKPNRTKTGRISVNRRSLKEINNPLTDDISSYRDLEKLLSTLKAIQTATDKISGKIYCTYTDDCPSGRLYTQNYSFQSIPESVRCIVYPDEGCSFVLADYSMFELRILSALAGDTYFKGCWEQGLDLHRKVVSDMKGIAYDLVTDKQRKAGKALSFGLSYGQEPMGLARNLHISISEAEKLMAVYKSKIPEIEKFKLEVVQKARMTGYTETFYGRKRFLPNITSPKSYDRLKAQRQVVNTCCQGTAADIVKFSLIELHKEGFKIDTMIHDSIILTVPDAQLNQSVKRIKEIMEQDLNGMKLPVTCKVGKSWGACK